ncbi:MAG: GTPase [Agitococcus sp.]
MQSYQPLFQQVAAAIKQYGRNRMSADTIRQSTQQIEQKLQNLKPTIMVYGIYNAGKSTLINALIGQEKAKVSDHPETDAVTEYHWQGMRLFDTPGIDAPIQHQNITEAHLKQTEVILFVVSSDGAFDERYIYTHLERILRANKPIILVLNAKTVLTENVEIQILAKIGHHLADVCTKIGLSAQMRQIDVFSVNAKSALKARLENKQKLLVSSRIEKLEARIAEVMQQVGLKESLSNLSALSLERLTDIEQAILQQISQQDTNGISSMSSHIQSAIQRVNSKAEQAIRSEMLSFEMALKTILLNATRPELLEQQINQLVQQSVTSIETQMVDLLATLATSIEKKCQFMAQAATNDLSLPTANEASLQMISSVSSFAKDLTSKQIKTALVAGKNLGLPILSNTGLKALGQWAATLSKAMPYITAAFQVLFEIWGNSQAEKKANERALLVNQKAVELKNSLQEQLLAQLAESMIHIEQGMQQPLIQEKAKANENLQQLQTDLTVITHLKAQIASLNVS